MTDYSGLRRAYEMDTAEEPPCPECGTSTCHRNQYNPYCATTVRVRCELCGRARMVRGLHFCEDEGGEDRPV